MAVPWLVVCLLLSQTILTIYCLPTQENRSNIDISPGVKAKLVAELIDYLKSGDENQYEYVPEFRLQDIIQENNSLKVTIPFHITCLPEIQCKRPNFVICKSVLIETEDADFDIKSMSCFDDASESIQAMIADINSPVAMTKHFIESTENNYQPQLSYEITSQSSGEEFIATPVESGNYCLGCLENLNTNIEGVSELVQTALKHVESENGQKHVLINVLKVQRQIVAGVLFNLLLEIAPVSCENTEEPADKCSEFTGEPKYCEVKYLQTPWINKVKSIISNNCTISQEFSPVLPSTTARNDFDNEIDINNDYHSKPMPIPQEDDPVVDIEMSDGSPNFDKMAETGSIVDNDEMSPERLASLEAQILFDEFVDKYEQMAKTDKKTTAKTTEPLLTQNILHTTVDNSQIGVDDIPSVLLTQNGDFYDATTLENDPEKENTLKKVEEPENINQQKLLLLERPQIQQEMRNLKSNQNQENNDDSYMDDVQKLKRQVENSKSSESSESSEENTKSANVKRQASNGDSKNTSEDSKNTSEETDDVLRLRRESGKSSEESSGSSEETAPKVKRQTDEKSSEESNETSEEKDKTPRVRREVEKSSEESNESSEEDKTPRVKREVGKSSEECKESLEEEHITLRVRREIGKSSEESKESSEEKDNAPRVRREAKSSESSESSEEKHNDSRVRREAKSSESSESSEEKDNAPRVKRETKSSESTESNSDSSEEKNKQSRVRRDLQTVDYKTLRNAAPSIISLLQNYSDQFKMILGIESISKSSLTLSENPTYTVKLRVASFNCLKSTDGSLLQSSFSQCTPDFSHHTEDTVSLETRSVDSKVHVRKPRGIPGAPNQRNKDDPKIKELLYSSLLQLDNESSHDTKYKIVEILSASSQVVAGSLYRITAKIIPSDCLKSKDVDPQNCGELKEAQPVICELKIWDRPWLRDGRETNITCESGISHTFRSRRSVPIARTKTSEHDKQLLTHYRFQQFQQLHSVSYSSETERRYREKIFAANMKTADRFNIFEETDGDDDDNNRAIYGISKFADRTVGEFNRLLGLVPSLREENSVGFPPAEIPNIKVPEEFDWRDKGAVTHVKNQGSCGSCWAFSVTGNVEGQYAVHHGALLEFSEQELVDCDKKDAGCNGGFMDNAYLAIEEMGGLELESDYPYDGKVEKCHFNKSLTRVELSGAVNITTDEEDMAKWLVKNGPISIGINANAMQFYMGGVSHPWSFLCSKTSLDHGVLIVGYGVYTNKYFNKSSPYWIVKNSWGPSWGEQGYYRVYRGDSTCGVNQMASSSIVK